MAAWDAFVWLSKLLPELVFPLTLAFGLGVAVWIRGGMRRWQRVCLFAALAILWLGGNGFVAKALVASLERRHLPSAEPPSAAAIVVLGSATEPALPPRTEVELPEAGDRLLHAARLFRRGKAPLVLVCAGRPEFARYAAPEASDMAEVLHLLGVPPESILEERQSRNTYENALEAKRALEPRGVERILLVTSAMHMPRAVGLFRHVGFDVIPAPTDFAAVDLPWPHDLRGRALLALGFVLPSAEALASTTRALREHLGLAVYRALGLLG